MIWWILVAVVVVGLGVYAFWPRRRGIVDNEVWRSRQLDKGRAGNYDNPSGPNFGGPI